MNRINVGNIPVDLFSVDSLHDAVYEVIQSKKKTVFLHSNARLVELANTSDVWLQDFFSQQRTFVICDGAGIQLGAKITGQIVPEKIAYNVWIWKFVEFLAKNNLSIFLLGADQNTNLKAVNNLKAFCPRLTVAGYHHGYFDKSSQSQENRVVLDKIRNTKPSVLLVGFGMPVQEAWIKQNLDSIEAGAIFSCGGAFDFISGKSRVAPVLFRKLYIEWFFRFLLEPMRLFSRATRSNFTFLKVVFKQSIRRL